MTRVNYIILVMDDRPHFLFPIGENDGTKRHFAVCQQLVGLGFRVLGQCLGFRVFLATFRLRRNF